MFDDYKTSASILIVDDEPNNLKVLHNLLTQNDYDVRAARDGTTALEAARATNPDLILLDIKMPDMDGYEVCKIMKADADLADIPIIFISALNNVTDIVHAFKVGGVDYITKPFQFEEVIARVETHLTIIFQQRQLKFQSDQLEQMRERDQARFNKVNAIREQFIQAATHDLKNPLAVIIGCADLMKRFDEVRSHPQLRELVDSVADSSDDMLNLVVGMLDIIKMQSSLSLDLERVNFNEFVEDSVITLRVLASERNIQIDYQPSGEIVKDLDKAMMQRVVDNLLSNAIKYSPDNSTVRVLTGIEDNQIVLEVADEGFGIDQAHLSHIFEPFFRAKKHDGERRIEGTGLGLSVVKEIVEQHNGHVTVESDFGEGTTFSVYLRAD